MSSYYLDIHTTPNYSTKLNDTVDLMKRHLLEREIEIAEPRKTLVELISSPELSKDEISFVNLLFDLAQANNNFKKELERLRENFNLDEPIENKEALQFLVDKLHYKSVYKKLFLEKMRNPFQEAFPEDRRIKLSADVALCGKTMLKFIEIQIKQEQAFMDLVEPYLSRYERKFVSVGKEKPIKFPLPTEAYKVLYQFYLDFHQDAQEVFEALDEEDMGHCNEIYILFFPWINLFVEGELLKNESDTTPNAEFCEKFEIFKKRLIERENLIKTWKIDALKENASFNAITLKLERLMKEYGISIKHHLVLKIIEKQRLFDIKKEAEREAKESLEIAQITPAVKVVEEKETTTTSSQNIFTVSEKLEIKQKDPIKETSTKEIFIDSSRQSLRDKSLPITEKSSPQEKEKTALKKPHPKPELKLPLKEEKKDTSNFVKKSPALLARHKLFKSEMSESKIIDKKPNKALRKILDKKEGNVFHNKLTVTQISCAMKSLNGTFHNAKGGGSGQKGSLIGKKTRSVFFHRPHGGRNTLCPRAVKEFYQLIEHSQDKKKVKALPATQADNKKEVNLRKGR